jgi:hypothetical protein
MTYYARFEPIEGQLFRFDNSAETAVVAETSTRKSESVNRYFV